MTIKAIKKLTAGDINQMLTQGFKYQNNLSLTKNSCLITVR